MARRMECPYCGNDMEPRYETMLEFPIVKAFMFCNECGSMSPKTKLEFSMIDSDTLIDFINEEWVKKKKDKDEDEDEEMYAKVSEALRNHRRTGVD